METAIIKLIEKDGGLVKNEDIVKIMGITTIPYIRRRLITLMHDYTIRRDGNCWIFKKLKIIEKEEKERNEYKKTKIEVEMRSKEVMKYYEKTNIEVEMRRKKVMKYYEDHTTEQFEEFDKDPKELLCGIAEIIIGKSEKNDLVYQLVIRKQEDIFNATGIKISIKDIIKRSVELGINRY